MKLVYEAIFTPFEKGEGYTVEVPDLPGCVTEGDNLAELLKWDRMPHLAGFSESLKMVIVSHVQVFHLLSLFPKDHLQIFLY